MLTLEAKIVGLCQARFRLNLSQRESRVNVEIFSV